MDKNIALKFSGTRYASAASKPSSLAKLQDPGIGLDVINDIRRKVNLGRQHKDAVADGRLQVLKIQINEAIAGVQMDATERLVSRLKDHQGAISETSHLVHEGINRAHLQTNARTMDASIVLASEEERLNKAIDEREGLSEEVKARLKMLVQETSVGLTMRAINNGVLVHDQLDRTFHAVLSAGEIEGNQ